MKKCVVNLSTPNDWYARGQARMVRTLKAHGFDGDFLCWNDESEVGAPRHVAVPYGFKTSALMLARDAGYDLALWLDASMWATKSVDAIFQQIEREGHVLELAGWSVGQWCTDAALISLGVAREYAMGISLFSAGFAGLNFRNPRSEEFLLRWHEKSRDGVSFIGPWTNENKSCSQDPRVLGHRHDMTAGSVIAHRLEMRIQVPTFMVYDGPGPFPETACIRCRGGVL